MPNSTLSSMIFKIVDFKCYNAIVNGTLLHRPKMVATNIVGATNILKGNVSKKVYNYVI